MIGKLCSVVCALLLTGCAIGPHSEYAEPKMLLPAQWAHASSPTGRGMTTEAGAWWRGFNDPVLNRLIRDALARNSDLALSGLKLRKARLLAGLAADAGRPVLSATLSSTQSLSGTQGGASVNAGNATLSLAYEVDLWGKLARTHDAAAWEAEASEQDLASTALSLSGTVAQLYWSIAYLNQRIALSENSLAYAEKTLALAQARHAAGAVSAQDEVNAASELASLQAGHTQWLEQREEAYGALAILYDGPPEQVLSQASRLPAGPLPEIPAGLPADLLAHRPDLRAAELRLRASLASVDQVRASYYPSLTLTAALGGSSSALHDVLQHPLATLGENLVLPFMQWNEMKLNIQVSQTAYQEAVVGFRQTLYNALNEVENALSARRQLDAQTQALQHALALAMYTERLDEVRYRAGAVALQSWLDAQDARRSAEADLAVARRNQLDNLATICLALGGTVQLAPGKG